MLSEDSVHTDEGTLPCLSTRPVLASKPSPVLCREAEATAACMVGLLHCMLWLFVMAWSCGKPRGEAWLEGYVLDGIVNETLAVLQASSCTS